MLGESHALRQSCRGVKDQHWRSRMIAVLDLEAGADAALRARLSRAFNAGFEAERARHPACGEAARLEAAHEAEHGRVLAEALAGHAAARPRPGERG